MTANSLRVKENFFLGATEVFAFEFGDTGDVPDSALGPLPALEDFMSPEGELLAGVDGEEEEAGSAPSDGSGDEEARAARKEARLAEAKEQARVLQLRRNHEALKTKVPTAEEVFKAFDDCLDVGAAFLRIPVKEVSGCRKAHEAALERYSVWLQRAYRQKQKDRRKRLAAKRAREGDDDSESD
jgi:hypothetical protein